MPLSPQCAHFVTEFNALVEVAVVIIFSVASFPVFKEDIILSMKDTVNINEIKSVNGLDFFLSRCPWKMNACIHLLPSSRKIFHMWIMKSKLRLALEVCLYVFVLFLFMS